MSYLNSNPNSFAPSPVWQSYNNVKFKDQSYDGKALE